VIIIILLITFVVVIAAWYPLYKARGEGRDIGCRNCIGSLACALMMYTQSWDGHMPPTPQALFPDQVCDLNIFRGCR
jgi:hypothetical protein